MDGKGLRVAVAVGALAVTSVMAAGESAEAFAGRIAKKPGSAAVVNLREDKSLGAITISLAPEVLADRASLQDLLAEIARFARDNELRATVVTPTKADNEFVVETLKSHGVARIKTQVMAEMVSIKTTRIFLSPAR
jgi:hypothetical protein